MNLKTILGIVLAAFVVGAAIWMHIRSQKK